MPSKPVVPALPPLPRGWTKTVRSAVAARPHVCVMAIEATDMAWTTADRTVLV